MGHTLILPVLPKALHTQGRLPSGPGARQKLPRSLLKWVGPTPRGYSVHQWWPGSPDLGRSMSGAWQVMSSSLGLGGGGIPSLLPPPCHLQCQAQRSPRVPGAPPSRALLSPRIPAEWGVLGSLITGQ